MRKVVGRRLASGAAATNSCAGHAGEPATANRPVHDLPATDVLLDERQLADRWNCSPKTLRNQRSLGTGCRHVRIGRLIRYRLSDVIAHETAGSSR